MGMTNDGLSYWQADTESEPLLEFTIGDLLDRRADEIPAQEAVVYSCYPEFSGALDIRWSYAVFRERVVYRNSKRTFCHRRTAKRCVPHVSSAFPGQFFACTLNI